MLVRVIFFSLLLSGPRFFPSPHRPWKIETRPAPGRCTDRAQKYRPRACARQDRDWLEGCRSQGCGWRPSWWWRRWPPAPSRRGGARLGGGLRHPLAQPRPPAASRLRVKLTCAAAALCAPSSALRKLWPGPLPQPGPGAGPTPAHSQSGVGPRSLRPILASPPRSGWTGRKYSRGIPPPLPTLSDTPRYGAVDLSAPPKPRRAVPSQGCR